MKFQYESENYLTHEEQLLTFYLTDNRFSKKVMGRDRCFIIDFFNFACYWVSDFCCSSFEATVDHALPNAIFTRNILA